MKSGPFSTKAAKGFPYSGASGHIIMGQGHGKQNSQDPCHELFFGPIPTFTVKLYWLFIKLNIFVESNIANKNAMSCQERVLWFSKE